MTLFLEYIQSDLYRYNGRRGFVEFVKVFLGQKGFRFSFFLRLAYFSRNILGLNLFTVFIFRLAKLIYNTDANFRATIGKGLELRHVYGMTWGSPVVMGENVVITHNVTIAGKNGQFPSIGDNVYLGCGCVVLGNIRIGNHVVIGANAVVVKDVPDGCVVAGNPARILPNKNTQDYIKNPI